MVEVLPGDGATYPVADYQIVFVALQTASKKVILAHLMENGPAGLRIVVRQPRKRFAVFYDRVFGSLEPVSGVAQDKAAFSHYFTVRQRG
jgi:hypothetical protein